MISLILRLFALRPLLSMAIFGIPVLALVAIGIITVFALKILVFIVLPILLVVWLVRRFRRQSTIVEP
jgi:hypothetical protein